ncbi:hypothetical protein ADT25_16890 [Xanthomonas oryzae]|uniref:Uncharacterized protein n=1 Tax=Xanthomonas oryzae TaxID=347 RepID=A0AAP0ZJY2_9XANT|nr:hypothetical protein ADT25_16890 [Xanthomonas oryzae]QBG85656.1 hypothetical protein EYR27_20020 [Xanthomonas oryzae]
MWARLGAVRAAILAMPCLRDRMRLAAAIKVASGQGRALVRAGRLPRRLGNDRAQARAQPDGQVGSVEQACIWRRPLEMAAPLHVWTLCA